MTEPNHAEASPRPPRRLRYAGTHPRRFSEKYKEHNPAKYPATVAKVLASGKTPAGSHRPICQHEILEILRPQQGEIALDATLGYGGHSRELLARILPEGRLLAMDADPIELNRTTQRLIESGIGRDNFVTRRANFAGALQFIFDEGCEGVDCLVADLGLSSMQIDDPSRGFSFKFDGPLDMRMNPSRGLPASKVISRWSEHDWHQALVENSDEPNADLLARHLVEVQSIRSFVTTFDLAQAVRDCLRRLPTKSDRDEKEKSVRRVFQAVRVAVNDEFGALETFLRQLPQCLRPGARAAILTFHSGEDRRVKQAFREGRRQSLYSAISEEIVRPGRDEIFSNPRAASAKLRWAVRANQSTV